MDERRFSHCYNSARFAEREDDPFSAAEVRRKCLALAFFSSLQLGQRDDVTNHVLRKKLEEYVAVVDDAAPGNVDNYSESIAALVPPNHHGHGTWKSALSQVPLEELVKPLPCASRGGVQCRSRVIDERHLENLREAFAKYKEDSESCDPEKEVVVSNSRDAIGDCGANPSHCKQQTRGSMENAKRKAISFRTAREELHAQNVRKYGSSCSEGAVAHAPVKKSLGTRKTGGVFNKFQPPTLIKKDESVVSGEVSHDEGRQVAEGMQEADERLKNIDPKMIELIRSEIMDSATTVTWDDIAGLELAKCTIQEIVVWPMLRPDIFTGLRRPPKGILLFGPPGTGKTLIGKCIASQSCSTFFSISASSLTSKWIGDGEKMVRALFAVARCHQPAVVFIDEIDSLLSQRSDSEHESSRRLKTEFLVQLDGAGTADEDRILIIGATNRPQELDEAARRRLVKRLYIPLPDEKARAQIIRNLISKERHCLTSDEIREISVLCRGYSGADVKNLCQEASLGPIRSIPPAEIRNIDPDEVRALSFADFKSALARIKSSVSERDLDTYVDWDKQYGCGGSVDS